MTAPAWSLEEVLATRPGVRVNQLGYLPHGPKCATWVGDEVRPVDFTVRDAEGTVLFAGRSVPWPQRPEPTSGLSVHVLDFTAMAAQPGVCQVVVQGRPSHPFRIAAGLYEQLGRDALGLFYLQRSGCPIDGSRAPGYARPAGHVGVSPNRGDTAVPAWAGPDADRLYPRWRQPGLFDVSGGWYDAGDYGKYTVSGGIALWQLLALADLPTQHPGFDTRPVLEECRWQPDWMLRMQVPAGQPLAGLAFHRVHGTVWSPLPGCAHHDPTVRVVHRPSTAASLHVAATAAVGARLFALDDPAYAARLLTAARTAHRAAHAHPNLIAPDDEGRYGGGPYGDPDVGDDFYWAATELWVTTGEDQFKTEIERSAWHTRDVFDPGGFDFDRVAAPARLDLARCPRRLPDHRRVRASVTEAAQRLLDLQDRQPWGQPYAPRDGWDWGSNGRILNNLVILAVAHTLTGGRRFRDGAAAGMDYCLGRNALGQSYVTGYGTDSTRHQRTRQFGHDLDHRLPPAPAGALAGGANSKPTPGFPSDPRWPACPRNAATWTSRPPRPPTTSASAGTHHWRTWPPISTSPSARYDAPPIAHLSVGRRRSEVI